jgi:hypothetical protein
MNKKDKVANEHNSVYDKNIEMENNTKSQIKKVKEEIGQMEEYEDVTKYGEFVSSYFAWLSLEKQKSKAKEMEDIEQK